MYFTVGMVPMVLLAIELRGWVSQTKGGYPPSPWLCSNRSYPPALWVGGCPGYPSPRLDKRDPPFTAMAVSWWGRLPCAGASPCSCTVTPRPEMQVCRCSPAIPMSMRAPEGEGHGWRVDTERGDRDVAGIRLSGHVQGSIMILFCSVQAYLKEIADSQFPVCKRSASSA